MPHRVLDPYPMPSHRHFDRRPSPPTAPPIATLSSTNSPTPSVSSLDQSSVSTPPTRRSPPLSHAAPPYYASHSQTYYSHPPPPVNHHSGHRGYGSHGGSHYSVTDAPPPFVTHHMSGASPVGVPLGGMNGIHPVRDSYGPGMPMHYPGAPINSNIHIVYTEDAATKLSDRVRRRCFNCCTTDTSTWRRSNLSPGKVLCNKCGLFERTHSRPRPEQFPHKRGPLANSALRSRSPPSQPSPHTLPPPVHHQSAGHGSTAQGSPPMSNTLPPISPPYSYSHPSLAPLSSAVSSQPSNGSHHASRREEEIRRPWQDRDSPPVSRRSPPSSGRASPGPLSSESATSTKPLHSRHERDDA
ncbi:hypothetical protein GYMLUDRAFT_48883 [Collybiopsis luxurians FD-317 M1]|uniref:GATA-type domain-containing protein n=1 Tax=Collybiopsis luxurians FD-317 M1 TaxID=944289 RepID=A0A0D0CGY0_9AGAR|nr:hypothetical protein GYMLUDRAFT_48883 [Collybiopsis luxurians FD-317 M1]